MGAPHPSSTPAQPETSLWTGHRLLRGEAPSSEEGLNPYNFRQAALLTSPPAPPPAPALPGRHRTQHLPRPCHLGRLTHVSPTAAATSSAVESPRLSAINRGRGVRRTTS